MDSSVGQRVPGLKLILWSSPSHPNLQVVELLLIARELHGPRFTDALAEDAVDLGVPGDFPMSIQVSSPPLYFLALGRDILQILLSNICIIRMEM